LTVFVDTSAVCALLDRVDPRHPAIAEAFTELTGHPLLTHSYVVLESTALVERRLGRQISRRLRLDVLAPVDVVLVDDQLMKPHSVRTSPPRRATYRSWTRRASR